MSINSNKIMLAGTKSDPVSRYRNRDGAAKSASKKYSSLILLNMCSTRLTSGMWTKRCRKENQETGSETCNVLNVKDPCRSSIPSFDLLHALALVVARRTMHSPFLSLLAFLSPLSAATSGRLD